VGSVFLFDDLAIRRHLKLEETPGKLRVDLDAAENEFLLVPGLVEKNDLADEPVPGVRLQQQIGEFPLFPGGQLELDGVRIVRREGAGFDMVGFAESLCPGKYRQDAGFILILGRTAPDQLVIPGDVKKK